MSADRVHLARVLVVDDTDDFRWILRTILQASSAVGTVLEAGDGAAALELVRREQPHLVVIDIMMPRLDGLEATRRIKTGWPATKVIVVTSTADAVFHREALRAGADAFLEKRVAIEALGPLVERLLRNALASSAEGSPPASPAGKG